MFKQLIDFHTDPLEVRASLVVDSAIVQQKSLVVHSFLLSDGKISRPIPYGTIYKVAAILAIPTTLTLSMVSCKSNKFIILPLQLIHHYSRSLYLELLLHIFRRCGGV